MIPSNVNEVFSSESMPSEVDAPLISVLVAAYNVEDTFEVCMNSIIGQTYGNLEIVVIDDGSTDDTPQLCDSVASMDNRVIVKHQINGGLSAARNAGLEYATGDYIIFADSDDYMLPTMIDTLYCLAKRTNSDIVYCEWFTNKKNGATAGEIEIEIMGPDEFMPQILTDKITSHAWNKLFKRCLWDEIRFPLGRVAQDMAVMHLAFAKALSVVHTSEQLYVYYAENPDNTSNRNKSKPASSIDRAYALESRYELACKHYPDAAEEVFRQLALFQVSAYYKALICGDKRKDAIGTWLKRNSAYLQSSRIDGIRKLLAAAAGTPFERVIAHIVAQRITSI